MKKETKQKIWHYIVTIVASMLTALTTSSCVVDVKPPSPTQVTPIYAQ